jgi:acrylyl-CoA reductase (NADPH)
MFDALMLDQTDDALTADVRSLDDADLPEGDVLVEVLYSSLNYKDALAITGAGKIIRGEFPFVPGIDLVGRVTASESDAFAPGDLVIQTGWGLGEHHWGGYAQQQRVRAEWLVPLPDGMTPEAAMIIGTAGFTAMLAVMLLEEHDVTPEGGEVVVTGASGGAGSFAVALLAALGYTTVASTGTEAAHDYLNDLGATRIIGREAFSDGPKRPMQSAKWAGAIDAVGGPTLATIIAELERHGSVAAFGNAGGYELNTTVFPFILRGVNLLGVDSNTCPNERRRIAWQRLSDILSDAVLDRIHTDTVGLADLPEAGRSVLNNEVRGRLLVDVNA